VRESTTWIEEHEGLLDGEERERAARFRVEAARRRFVTGHVMLRRVLSDLTGVEPERLCFAFGEHGKPRLLDGGPYFNLAHSGDAVVLAVADDEVGVDVEELRPLSSTDRLARRICTPRELGELLARGVGARSAALLRLWTAKEAVLKALGSGIRGSMRSIEVSLDADGKLRLLSLQGEPTSWTLLDAPAPDGTVAAVAVARPSCRLESRPFPKA
jgi:4'-phosphopantetheinyl transferase